ncbi:type I restriction modification DNA specificity domain protein [Bacteroides intestinalis DSM 17393]|uniref:Type I restriction modification DNA specificity domain protein n=2 Tax=Bacteroidaceae TaxID=815 RepID=B3CDL3_9BACE|nr:MULTISPECIES: restriction endonuclease subunit S [Bacteroidaceae]EDV04859.1 type I restriction modification DNA specificity domain protein [Bacteroides intestinalis DSM 17393]TDA75480.1 restriction endonuclease subunit S [Phocaeicola dorei]
MEQWKQDRLIDILDTLIDYRGKTPNKVERGIPLITAKIVKNGRIETPTEFLPAEEYRDWMVRGYPQVGDVVLTTEAPLGEVAQLKDDKIALAQRIVCLRGKEDALDNTYLKYFLMSNIGQYRLKARETGTTVTGIKQSELKEVLIDYPNYELQQKIASILSSLDSKIELNRRINDNLEQQAQAWLNELLDRYANSTTVLIHEIAEINPKRNLSKGTSAKCIEMANLPTTGSFPNGWIEKEYNGGMKFCNGDTLIARITPCLENGKTAFINFLDKNEIAYGSTEYIVISAKSNYSSSFFYFLARNHDFVDYAVKNMNGSSGRQRVSGDTISKYRIPVIPREKLESFTNHAEIALKTIKNNSLQNMRLSMTRDALLPKLMSGELKVNDLNS